MGYTCTVYRDRYNSMEWNVLVCKMHLACTLAQSNDHSSAMVLCLLMQFVQVSVTTSAVRNTSTATMSYNVPMCTGYFIILLAEIIHCYSAFSWKSLCNQAARINVPKKLYIEYVFVFVYIKKNRPM